MREIKFRAWSELDKEMFEVASIDLLLGLIVRQCENKIKTYVLEELILMQLTGLKDKNGKEIYEGGLLSNETGRICKIIWCDKAAAFDVVPLNGLGTAENFEPYYWHKCEAIGNIYENPELMKAKIK